MVVLHVHFQLLVAHADAPASPIACYQRETSDTVNVCNQFNIGQQAIIQNPAKFCFELGTCSYLKIMRTSSLRSSHLPCTVYTETIIDRSSEIHHQIELRYFMRKIVTATDRNKKPLIHSVHTIEKISEKLLDSSSLVHPLNCLI